MPIFSRFVIGENLNPSSPARFANFLKNRYPGVDFTLLSSGTIPISNIAIGLKVAASLFLIFVILAVLRIVLAEDGSHKMIQKEEEE